MDEEDEYLMYKERMASLSDLKSKLAKAAKESAEVNSKYVKYLAQNPYKQSKKKLNKEVADLRDEIMKQIPEKFG
jgi:phage-related minor tail protein